MYIPDSLPTCRLDPTTPSTARPASSSTSPVSRAKSGTIVPDCTHPLLAHGARTTNDLLRESDRARLVPLIGRLFGTTDDSPELETAEAYALTALVIAHRIAASGECRADCGNGSARARRMFKDLAGLIDVYDEVTGRTETPLTQDDVRELIQSVYA